MKLRNEGDVLVWRLAIWPCVILTALLFVFLIVTDAEARELDDESSVAAWKYTYPNDDKAEFAGRLGYILGVLDSIGIIEDGYTDAHAKCVFNNFWPEEPSHVGGVIEAVYAQVLKLGLSPDDFSFVDGLVTTVYLTCMPELFLDEDTSAQDEWRST